MHFSTYIMIIWTFFLDLKFEERPFPNQLTLERVIYLKKPYYSLFKKILKPEELLPLNTTDNF